MTQDYNLTSLYMILYHNFKRKGWYWIGYDDSTGGYIIHENCPYDYCLPADSATVNFSDSQGADSQCNFNRTGVLCGICTCLLLLLIACAVQKHGMECSF